MAIKVLPSPEIVEVTAILFDPFSAEINCILARIDRKASDINDLGLSSTTSSDGWRFLGKVGITPRIDASQCLERSDTERIL